MKLTECEYSKCQSCGQRDKLIQEETYGCDQCGKVDLNKKGVEYIDVSIFRRGSEGTESEHRQYCSWKCCLKNLRKVKTDYFISMPFLQYEPGTQKGLRAKDFFALIKG